MSLVSPALTPASHRFSSVKQLITDRRPNEPIYAVFPEKLREKVTEFHLGFPGRTLYAVKCNPATTVLDALYAAGIRDFDVASLAEIDLVHNRYPDAHKYMMATFQPVGAYATAYRDYEIRDFAVDTEEALDALFYETGADDLTIYVRLATDDDRAMFELSSKFGADHETAVRILRKITAKGATPALTFHVGSQCGDPSAYLRAADMCEEITKMAGVAVQTIDVGGGFPCPYPGAPTPPIDQFFSTQSVFRQKEVFGHALNLMSEPGRALVAEGVSLITQVMLRKDNQLYLNDGAYGSFMERNLEGAKINYPVRAFRANGSGGIEQINDALQSYTVFGPTCDSCDKLNDPMSLPGNLKRGDWIEFGMMGAYSNAYASNFNGYLPSTFVEIGDADALDGGGTVVAL